MRISAGALQEFVSDTTMAADQLALAAATNRLVEAMGYKWCSYRSIDHEPALVVSTYPAALSDHCLSTAFRDVDPIVNAARQQRGPFYWQIPDIEEPLNERAAQFFKAAASFKIKSGLTVPLRNGSEPTAIFTVSTDQEYRDEHPQAEHFKAFVETCAVHLHGQFCATDAGSEKSGAHEDLTDRQRTCLAAAADGLSAKQVAREIGLTPRTVKHHYDEAKRRLDAESLPHAVALAIRRGIIS